MRAQECSPLLVTACWRWDSSAAQDPADRAGTDPVPQAAQLALDTHHPPGPILAGAADDRLDARLTERRASRRPRLGPFPGHHPAMPPQQRARRHDPMQPQRFRQHSRQRRKHGTIGPPKTRIRVRPAQQRHLVAQHQYLGVLGRRRPGQQRQPGQHRYREPVDQTNSHDRLLSQVRAGGRVSEVLQRPGAVAVGPDTMSRNPCLRQGSGRNIPERGPGPGLQLELPNRFPFQWQYAKTFTLICRVRWRCCRRPHCGGGGLQLRP